ncbi:MAG TPA: hypothetical protein DDX98_12980 [Bacteroidales bacterium]|jgi:enoyl reductase-like protein|nr:hypothetical protein [Bacteroidales bacterium]
MKKILLSLVAVAFAFTVNAQSENDYLEIARDVLKTEKKSAIAEVMQLTDAESTTFWELYNEYQGKLYIVQNKRIAIINDFAKNYENLTNEKADELWVNTMKYKQEVLKLKKTYYAKFKKILPAGKAARFMHAENKIETMINAQLALEIPLIETKE